jgi:hypothetical protein
MRGNERCNLSAVVEAAQARSVRCGGPFDLCLDALYFLAPEEREYAERLAQLKVEPGVGVSANLLFLSAPLVPYHWPLPQCFCPRDFRNFSSKWRLAQSR